MIKKNFYLGFVGLFGFNSLKYFFTKDISDLYFIMFFAFFSHFFISKINGDKADERYQENHIIAMSLVGDLSMISMFLIWCLTFTLKKIEITMLLLSIAYAIIHNVYAIKLYKLEEV